MRRGSASLTSNSIPFLCIIISPRCGTRRQRKYKTAQRINILIFINQSNASFSSSCSIGRRALSLQNVATSGHYLRAGLIVIFIFNLTDNFSIKSSIVTSPSVPPYSSTTKAMCERDACIRSNKSSAGIEGGQIECHE